MCSCSWCLCFVVESNYLLTRWLWIDFESWGIFHFPCRNKSGSLINPGDWGWRWIWAENECWCLRATSDWKNQAALKCSQLWAHLYLLGCDWCRFSKKIQQLISRMPWKTGFFKRDPSKENQIERAQSISCYHWISNNNKLFLALKAIKNTHKKTKIKKECATLQGQVSHHRRHLTSPKRDIGFWVRWEVRLDDL